GQSINNLSYYSATTTLLEGMKIKEAHAETYEDTFDWFEDSTFAVFIIVADEKAPETEYHLVNVYRNDSLITDTLYKKSLLSDLESSDALLYSFAGDNEYEAYDTITIEVFSISERYARFVEGVISISRPPDPLGFSGPQANVTGNIENALGFFYAADVSRAITTMIPAQEFE
ncbi:MAG: DUF4249 domain-containing protein, partial [Bacteroidales bacterium]|nr:DUF4249 domain-containing protein [Bacteroidales bacterium]